MFSLLAHRLGFRERDSPADILYVAGFFFAFLIIDTTTRMVAGYGPSGADVPMLLLTAFGNNPIGVLVLALGVAILLWRSPTRLFCSWSSLDQGHALRLLAVPVLFFLTWQSAFYQYNFLADRAHLGDRLLILALAGLVLWRPMFLGLYVVHNRIIAEQFELPFGTTAGQNFDHMLVIVLVALAGAHLMYVLTGRDDSAPVMLVIVAGYATHFFIPGRGKLLANWLIHEDLSNLAINSYTVGWLGQTDGGMALWLASILGPLGWPLRIGTVVLELGIVVAAAHHRVLRWCLPVLAVFHSINFLLLGFWFLAWVVLGLSLFVFLGRPSLRPWLDRNLTVARAAVIGAAIAVFGALLYNPAGLAWFDSPVAYGHLITVEGLDGTVSVVPSRSFEPFSQDIAFGQLQFGDTRRVTGAYGVVSSAQELAEFQKLTTVAQVEALEESRTSADQHGLDASVVMMEEFLDYANRRAAGQNRLADVFDVIGPFPRYWTVAPDPVYRFDHQIVSIEVARVTGLHTEHNGEHHLEHSRRTVFQLDGDTQEE